MNSDQLRRRLQRIIDQTDGAQNVLVAAYYQDDKPDARRVRDDIRSGRIAWQDAREEAVIGLQHLDAGDDAQALTFLWVATDWYIAALESRFEPGDRIALSTSAKKRSGRPAKMRKRDAALVAAVAAKEAKGLRGAGARKAAIKSDPAFATLADAGARKAIQRTRKPGQK
jgi:hypothetical protein